MKKAVIVAFDNFTDIDIFLSWDLLNRVKFRDKEFQVKIVGTKKSHRSVCEIDLATHGLIEESMMLTLCSLAAGLAHELRSKTILFLNVLN